MKSWKSRVRSVAPASAGRRARRPAPPGARPVRRHTLGASVVGLSPRRGSAGAISSRDLVGPLGRSEVRGVVEHDEPAVLHAVGDLAQQLRRGRPGPPSPAIASTGWAISASRSRTSKRREGVAHLDVARLSSASCSACSRAAAAVGVALEEAGGEPALGRRGHQHRRSRRLRDLADPVGPAAGVADAGAGAEQRGGRDAVGVVEQQLRGRPRRRRRRRRRRTASRVAALLLDVGDEREHALGELGHR